MKPTGKSLAGVHIVSGLFLALVLASPCPVLGQAEFHMYPEQPTPDWPIAFMAPGVNGFEVWIEDNEILLYSLCEVPRFNAAPGPHCIGRIAELEPLSVGHYTVRNLLGSESLPDFEVGAWFRRGDANADGSLDVSDAMTILGAIFLGDPELTCLDAADLEQKGSTSGVDPIHERCDIAPKKRYGRDAFFQGDPNRGQVEASVFPEQLVFRRHHRQGQVIGHGVGRGPLKIWSAAGAGARAARADEGGGRRV